MSKLSPMPTLTRKLAMLSTAPSSTSNATLAQRRRGILDCNALFAHFALGLRIGKQI